MKSIFTLTLSPAVDKSTEVDHVVAEHKLRCAEAKFEPGGGGINVSRAIKKLGGESTAIYTKGGPTGDLLQKLLNLEYISQLPVECVNWTRENFTVVETTSNQQFRFGMPGPSLMENEWRQCLDLLSDRNREIDYLVVSGSIPKGIPSDFFVQVARITKEKNCKLILDTSGDSLRQAMSIGVHMLKPNLNELAEMVGRELNTQHEQEEAALSLVQTGKIDVLVVSLGPSGAMLISKEGVYNVPAPSVRKRSTVGAGDSMVAGVVFSMARNWDLHDALRYGIACGTAATMNTGTGLCRKEDVEELFKWLKKK